jgi:DNA-binding NarL/FixJ family response regulator
MVDKSTSNVMSPSERQKSSILVVEIDGGERNNLRTALKALGYGGLSDAPTHAAALEKLAERKFTHIIFDAKKTNMPPKEFLEKALNFDPSMICIPSSFEPNVDDVFDLLVCGAKGYLCKPFTIDTVEDAVVSATKGEPISDLVLNAKDRNEALVAILMSSLDKASTVYRQSFQYETAKRELPKCLAYMKRSSDLAKTFSKNGTVGLIEAIEKFCLERSKGPATKLGRLRKRLQSNRKESTESESNRPF